MQSNSKLRISLKTRLYNRWIKRKSKGEIAFDIINTILIFLIVLILIYPFIYMLSVSFTHFEHVYDVVLFPIKPTINAYRFIFRNSGVIQGYLNSVLYTSVGVAISMFLTISTAYALSKRWLIGRKVLNVFVLITMYFGGGLIPTYLVVTGLGMTDSIWAIVIPGALSTYNMIVMRTYFQTSIPTEIEESCEIDGAGQWLILWKMYLPLSKPILATIGLFYLVAAWNNWFSASIYLSTDTKYPIQLMLRNVIMTNGSSFLGNSSAESAQLGKYGDINYLSLNYALTIAVVLPVLIIFPFCQKFFVKGVMVGSLKG